MNRKDTSTQYVRQQAYNLTDTKSKDHLRFSCYLDVSLVQNPKVWHMDMTAWQAAEQGLSRKTERLGKDLQSFVNTVMFSTGAFRVLLGKKWQGPQ